MNIYTEARNAQYEWGQTDNHKARRNLAIYTDHVEWEFFVFVCVWFFLLFRGRHTYVCVCRMDDGELWRPHNIYAVDKEEHKLIYEHIMCLWCIWLVLSLSEERSRLCFVCSVILSFQFEWKIRCGFWIQKITHTVRGWQNSISFVSSWIE